MNDLFVLYVNGEVYGTYTSEWEAKDTAFKHGEGERKIARYSCTEVEAYTPGGAL